MANCKIPAWDKSGKYIYFTASTDYGMNVGWLDMSSYDHPVTSSIYMAVLSKSPLAPQSDDEVAKKESDNTKSKIRKNDADEEKSR
jgi:tricorn protease